MTNKREIRMFNTEEIKMLAEAERKMDSGESPYVMLHGNRIMMDDDSMRYFCLEQGQNISYQIMIAITTYKIECIKKEMKAEKDQKKSKFSVIDGHGKNQT